jgi:CubicO group peptidase (beta-lactamase class C family)
VAVSAVLLALFIPASLRAQGKWINAGAATQIVGTHIKNHKVAGLSVAIVKDGKVIYAKGFGWKNMAKKIPASDITRYRLASVSKPITSLLAFELIRKDRLELDFMVKRYLRSLPTGHNYSTRHILGHLSGIRHYKDDDKTSSVSTHYVRMKDACGLFINDKLLFDPGDKYDYSTHAYSVLGWLIESLVDKPFRQYAVERFRAWGLTDLSPELSALQGVNRSEIYKVDDGKLKVSKRDDISWKYPGGGYECSARDMANLSIKVMEGKIIDRSYLDSVVWKSQTAGGESTGFGLGWDVGSRNGRRVVAHSGAQNGASSNWRLLPDDGIAVVVLSNTRHDGTGDLARTLADLALANTAAKPAQPQGKPIN